MELVGKPAHDLHVHEYPSAVFTVATLEAGYLRHLPGWRGLVPGLGVLVSANIVPPLLAPRDARRVASGVVVFLTVRPRRHAL